MLAMPTAASVMIAAKTEQGLVVGYADMVRGHSIGFWMNVPLQQGARIEFRLELPGADDTVLGWMRIEAGSGPPGSLVHYRAHVDTLDKGDLVPFQRWLHDAEVGRVSLHLREGLIKKGPFDQMHGATPAQTETALRRIDQRKRRFAHIGETPQAPIEELFVPGLFQPQPLGSSPPPPPAATVGPRDQPSPRTASPPPGTSPRPSVGVTDAKLASADWWMERHETRHRHQQALERQAKLESLLADSPSSPPPVPEAPVEAPAAPHPGVAVAVIGHGGGAVLSVSWRTHEDLLHGQIGELLGGFLRLRRQHLDTWPAHAHAHLVTPGGRDLRGEAFLIVDDGQHVVYQLELPASARDLLFREATGQS